MSNEQMKNQLEDQHMDESQLNARRIKEAWQVMTLGQKIEYLWMYYKSRLAGALLIAGAIYLGITMYKGTHTEVLINITVVGGNSQQVEWLENLSPNMPAFRRKTALLRFRRTCLPMPRTAHPR